MLSPYAPPSTEPPERKMLPPSRGWWIPIIATAISTILAFRTQAWDTLGILVAILFVVCIAPWLTRLEVVPDDAVPESEPPLASKEMQVLRTSEITDED